MSTLFLLIYINVNLQKEHKAGEFLPFGAGTRLCPGNDLAKMEIAVFLHHFILNYQ